MHTKGFYKVVATFYVDGQIGKYQLLKLLKK